MPRVLLAEDDFEMRRLLASVLQTDGYEVIEAADGAQLIEMIEPAVSSRGHVDLDLVISDIRMPEASGLEALARLRTHVGAPPIILITAFGDVETHAAAKRLGALAVLDKPFDVDELRAFARSVLPVDPGHAA